jgi:hypothetical protein
MRTLNTLLIVAMTLVLIAPSVALADKKKAASGKDTPTESVGLNFTKIQLERQGRTGPIKPVPPHASGSQHH